MIFYKFIPLEGNCLPGFFGQFRAVDVSYQGMFFQENIFKFLDIIF